MDGRINQQTAPRPLRVYGNCPTRLDAPLVLAVDVRDHGVGRRVVVDKQEGTGRLDDGTWCTIHGK